MTSLARFVASATVQLSPVRVSAVEPTNFCIAPLLIHGGATTIGLGGRCDKDLVCRGACLSGIVGGAQRRNKRPSPDAAPASGVKRPHVATIFLEAHHPSANAIARTSLMFLSTDPSFFFLLSDSYRRLLGKAL